MSICESTFYEMLKQESLSCERGSGHHGRHQSFSSGWVWSEGGGHTVSSDAPFCPTCGTQDVKSDIQKERVVGDQCATCDFWDGKEKLYDEGIVFVVDGDAFVLVPSQPQGYAGREVIVNFLDQDRIVGPTKGLWHNGTVPHERRNVMPDNATIAWT